MYAVINNSDEYGNMDISVIECQIIDREEKPEREDDTPMVKLSNNVFVHETMVCDSPDKAQSLATWIADNYKRNTIDYIRRLHQEGKLTEEARKRVPKSILTA